MGFVIYRAVEALDIDAAQSDVAFTTQMLLNDSLDPICDLTAGLDWPLTASNDTDLESLGHHDRRKFNEGLKLTFCMFLMYSIKNK
jgi:hypothetical protein